MTKDMIILLVEDNPADQELTLRAFRRSKVANEVVVVRDGQEALDYLFASGSYAGRDASKLPTVVLLDIRLPRVDGPEVLERMRADERTRSLPVVILTSSDEEQDRLAGHSDGASRCVRKPVRFVELVIAAQQLGLSWLLLSGPPTPVDDLAAVEER